MSLLAKKYSLGTPPGTLVETADVKARLIVVAYSPDGYEEVKAESVEECHQQIGKRDVTWIRVESYRDILSEMFNVYLSVKADSTNEVMKILTIFAAIFIPPTFMAGIYGMNFEFMPELRW